MKPQTRKDDVIVQEVGDELVVYDAQRHLAHRLNRSAATVWRHCDGGHSVADIAAALTADTGAACDDQLVTVALEQFSRAELLETALPIATGESRFSRRDAFRRLGVTGAAALIVPLVTTLAAPSPAQATSHGTCC